MACRVPGASSSCSGTVNVCCTPSEAMRRRFAWLPRVFTTTNPKRPSMRVTSRPERRLSLGDTERRRFDRELQGERGGEAQRVEVFPLQVQLDRLAQIRDRFVERASLRDDGE